MKFSKLLSTACAAAIAASALAIPASAEDVSYHAYLGVQSASYTFRNAWNDATYGQGITSDDGMVYFDQLTGWENPGNIAVSKGGVFTDAEITGDGTYSVSVTDFDFGEDESLNLLFVSTDIPLDAGITISDVKVIMDGSTKYTFDEAYLSPDEKEYVSPMCINIWNEDLGKQDGLFGYMMPTDSIELQFTVSGTGVEAETTEAAAEEVTEETTEEVTEAETTEEVTEAETEAETEAAETEAAETEAAAADTQPAEESSSSNVGVIIAIVAAVVVVAVVVVVVVKKKN
ncbi:MAG: hypothetical protein MRZ39_01015 [Oscillospiraceae bacterium]|nr:hypothetical protein [Oscillospiraceae bacterium]